MNSLRPDNVNVMLMSKQYAGQGICNEIEPWFQTNYAIDDIPAAWSQMWSSARPELFNQPGPNQYLATDFSLVQQPADGSSLPHVPVAINLPDEGFSLWYRQDGKFLVPKAIISFYLVSPIATDSPRRYIVAYLIELIIA